MIAKKAGGFRDMPSYRRLLFSMLTLAVLAGCAAFPKARYATVTPLPEDARPAPMSLAKVEFNMPTGADAGQWGKGWCGLKYPVERGDLLDAILTKDLKGAFHDTLKSEGYDVTGAPDLIFDEEITDDVLRSEYRIAAEIVDARTDVCYSDSTSMLALFTGRPGFTGQLYLKIRWHVFDALRRSSVYKVEEDGYAKRSVPNPEGMSLLMDGAFAMAAHNLGADPQFRDLIVHGVKPPLPSVPSMPSGAAPSPRPRRFDPSAPLVLPSLPLSKTPFADHADDMRKAAVLVQGGIDHGSGFFISRDGDILTASHVVGDALHARIKLSDRGKAYVAEVVRSDKARDVALLRLIDPPDFVPAVLPLRAAWPRVGEKVYAIGAPQSTRLQDSVTSGIVSAWRRDFKTHGVRQDFIQSDVTVQPGNSGGPLLDRWGNIVAITDAGVLNGDASEGLNYFAPVGEAMKALDISVR
jgi:S1-C subfamily serine protease